MKKYLFLASALLALVACNKEPIVQAPTGPAVLTFTSERPQFTTDTKTQWNGGTIVWSLGDKIRVGYTLNGTWMAKDGPADLTSETKVPAKFYASNAVSIDGTNASVGTFTIPTDFSNSPTGNAVFYGVYPSSQTSGDSYYAPSLTITIPSSQTPVVNENIASFDKTADILVGKTDGISLSGSFPTSVLEMNWTRVVAHADLTFKNLATTISSETIQSIKLTAGDNEYLAGSTYINVETGAVTTNSNTVNTITLNGTNISVSDNQIEAWACILPVTLTSLTVDIETDAAHYVKSFTGISKQFKANARNTLGINMSDATRTEKDVVAIPDGNYVIAGLSGSTYYAISSAANGTSTRRDRSKIATDNFNPADYSAASPYTAANNLIWTITNVTGGVTINLAGDTESYMQYGNNTLPLGSSSKTFAVSSEENTFRFTPEIGRAIAMNGTYGFGCYATGNSNYLYDYYLIPATGTPSLTFSEFSKTVSASTTAVDFEYESLFLSADPTVAVTEDNGHAVASTTVANSKVTVTLNENTTTSDKTIKLKVSANGVDDIVLTITQFGVVDPATVGDILWAEAFTGFADSTIPSSSNAETTVYGNESVTYACENGGGTTKVYGNDNIAGGTKPELLIAKSKGSFTVSEIPTGSATGMTLTFKSNNNYIAISSTTEGITIASPQFASKVYTVTITAANAVEKFNLIFTNTFSSNDRVDDFCLQAGVPEPGIEVATAAASATSSSEGTTATLNGTITLLNGADIADIDEAGFYYKLSSASSYTKVTLASVPTTTSFSYDLTGLTKDSEYTYYAYAIYDGGSEVDGTSTEKTFTPTSSAGTRVFTYVFTSKSWGSTESVSTGTAPGITWKPGQDGGQLTSGQGIQVTTTYSGANATSSASFTNVSKIVVTYCTNATKGAGAIKVKVGSGTEQSFSVTKPSSGGTTLKTTEFTFNPNESGAVKITAECTTNSVYIYSIAITATN